MFQYEYLNNIHKKATIGNVIKNVVENLTPSTLFMPMMNFSQSPFKPEISNFIPLWGIVQLDLQVKFFDIEYQNLINID